MLTGTCSCITVPASMVRSVEVSCLLPSQVGVLGARFCLHPLPYGGLSRRWQPSLAVLAGSALSQKAGSAL